jgi:hypothetical protein
MHGIAVAETAAFRFDKLTLRCIFGNMCRLVKLLILPPGRSYLAVVLLLGAACGARIDAAEGFCLSGAEKQQLMLDLVERFVPHAESYWRASNITIPRTGMYNASGPGVTQPRGAAHIALAYTTLMYARPKQQMFGGVSRSVLVDHTIQSIRHEAWSNRLVSKDGTWGGNEPPSARHPHPEPGTWQGALETYGWAFAAKMLWPELDEDTRDVVKRVVTGESDILLIKRPADAEPGNTGAEDNAWNMPLVALAATMFPDHPHAAAWRARAQLLAINAFSRAADRDSAEMVDGRPLRAWIQTANFLDDYSLDNHGFFNPLYIALHLDTAQASVFYALAKLPIPEAFTFRLTTVWQRVMAPLIADDGDVIMPAGQDWVAKDYQHLGYMAAVSTQGKQLDAAVAESRALTQIARRQSAHADGSFLGQPRLGYEATLIEGLASAWWMHHFFGPAPVPSRAEFESARGATSRVRQFPAVSLITARQRDAIVSMSWSNARPMGLVVVRATGHEDDPVFSAYTIGSAVGVVKEPVETYPCDCRDHFFSTAGRIGSRMFSMTSFPDGVTLLLDRGEGPTFSFSFERIPGLTEPRAVVSAEGERLGRLSGNWVNVGERFGLLTVGGGGIQAAEVVGRKAELPNPYLLVEGSTGTGTGNRGATVLPLTGIEATRELSGYLQQPVVPDGWSALLARAPDHTSRFAIARWSGVAVATFEITNPRGAPVLATPSVVRDRTAVVTWTLRKPGSTGEIVRFFAEADGALEARAQNEPRAQFTNNSKRQVALTVRYIDDAGHELAGKRVLKGGETITVARSGSRLNLGSPVEHQ